MLRARTLGQFQSTYYPGLAFDVVRDDHVMTEISMTDTTESQKHLLELVRPVGALDRTSWRDTIESPSHPLEFAHPGRVWNGA